MGHQGEDQPVGAAPRRDGESPGILATVGQTFSGQGINISEAVCRAGDDGRAVNVFTFMCSDLDELKLVMRALQKVQGVVAVERT